MAKPDLWAADFETTTDPNDCRVWGYGIAKLSAPDKTYFGKNIIDFLRHFTKMNATVFFHNLKFDGTFIIYQLLRQGYDQADGYRLSPKQFSVLYSNMGKMYSIRVRWTKDAVTEFRDSLKKLPMPLARVATSFGMEETKGEIDYHTFRPVGHVMTPEEKDYLRRDVKIVATAMAATWDAGMRKLTVGSDSLAEYKKLIGRNAFDRLFPVLSFDVDEEIRSAYRGGYTYADARYRGKHLKRPGKVYDVNSLYPYVMRYRKLPYGLPTRNEGEPPFTAGKLTVFRLTFTAKLRKGFLPIIQIKKSFQFLESEYLTEIDEPQTLTITDVDWTMWQKHYDVTVYSWHEYYEFDAAAGMFDVYIDKWSKIKAESVGGQREIAKLHLNSLYGKFATSCDVTGKYPMLEDDAVAWKMNDRETRDPVYTAIGVYVTAYAREIMIAAAQDNYDIFAYCDTDSLHILTEEEPADLHIHPHELGAWKHEGDFTEAKYIRAKAYAELIDGKMDVKLAGVPVDISAKLTFDQLRPGHVITGKLVPKNVPGGVVLVESPYEIKL